MIEIQIPSSALHWKNLSDIYLERFLGPSQFHSTTFPGLANFNVQSPADQISTLPCWRTPLVTIFMANHSF